MSWTVSRLFEHKESGAAVLQLAHSSTYTAGGGGETIDLSKLRFGDTLGALLTIEGDLVNDAGSVCYRVQYVKGTDLTDGKIVLWTAGAEPTSGTIAASGQVIAWIGRKYA